MVHVLKVCNTTNLDIIIGRKTEVVLCDDFAMILRLFVDITKYYKHNREKNRESVYEDRPEERLQEERIISLFPSTMAVVNTTDSH